MQGQTLDPTAVGEETVVSFLALRGVVTVAADTAISTVFCEHAHFHWNGTELVICSIGAASWPYLEAAPVTISLVAGSLRFHFRGDGSSDQVEGLAPEYVEQLVTYFGVDQGHALADDARATRSTQRLFVTPRWRSESADR